MCGPKKGRGHVGVEEEGQGRIFEEGRAVIRQGNRGGALVQQRQKKLLTGLIRRFSGLKEGAGREVLMRRTKGGAQPERPKERPQRGREKGTRSENSEKWSFRSMRRKKCWFDLRFGTKREAGNWPQDPVEGVRGMGRVEDVTSKGEQRPIEILVEDCSPLTFPRCSEKEMSRDAGR